MKTIRINAPECYGDPRYWALCQTKELERQGYQVEEICPIVNEKWELTAIDVIVK